MMDNAGSGAAWLAHAGLLAMVVTSLGPGVRPLRAGAAVAGLLLAAGAFFWLKQPWFALLPGLLFLINFIWFLLDWLPNRLTRFSPEEQVLRAQHLGQLDSVNARRLLDEGHWIAAKRGETLIHEGQAVPSLFYIAEGEAAIIRGGARVGSAVPGELVGEATVLDGNEATGTVVLASDARLWFIPAETLRVYLAANPGIASALHEGFARALRGKLANANARLAKEVPLS